MRPSILPNELRSNGNAARIHGSGEVMYRSNTAKARSGSRPARASIGSPIAATGLVGGSPLASSANSATAAASTGCMV